MPAGKISIENGRRIVSRGSYMTRVPTRSEVAALAEMGLWVEWCPDQRATGYGASLWRPALMSERVDIGPA